MASTTRSGVLASWPVAEYLNLLGTCRRDLHTLRTAGCQADALPDGQEEEDRVHELLGRLTLVIGERLEQGEGRQVSSRLMILSTSLQRR